jgi:hypothetical protein
VPLVIKRRHRTKLIVPPVGASKHSGTRASDGSASIGCAASVDLA